MFYRIGDPAEFLKLIQTWNVTLYNATHIISAAWSRVSTYLRDGGDASAPPLSCLVEALAILYENEGSPERTLQMHLLMKKGDVFGIIEKYKLYDQIADKVCRCC